MSRHGAQLAPERLQSSLDDLRVILATEHMNIRLRSLTRVAAVAAVALLATFTIPPKVRAGHRAHLSLDLLAHEARHSTTRRRVILTGDPANIAAIAARHQLQ